MDIVIRGLLLLAGVTVWSAAAEGASHTVEILQAENEVSARLEDRTLWTYHHDPAEGKPYFHPLSSADGTLFTALRPDDHPWHRGVWFSWKFINGVNYWEEDRATGQSEGRTLLRSTRRSVSPDRKTRIETDLAYAPAASAEHVMRETRTVVVHPPDAKGAYAIDWSSTFQALERDVVLDRTPLPGQPGGKNYGGYAGWSVRMNAETRGGTFLNSEEQSGQAANRQAASWVLFTAPEGGSLLFLDHPQNLDYPTKWYLAEGMPYFSPALIHDAPHTLRAGDRLQLRYRLAVLPEGTETEAAIADWAQWDSR